MKGWSHLQHMQLMHDADEFESLFFSLWKDAIEQSNYDIDKWQKAAKLLAPILTDVKS